MKFLKVIILSLSFYCQFSYAKEDVISKEVSISNDTQAFLKKGDKRCWDLAAMSAASAVARDKNYDQKAFTEFLISKKMTEGFRAAELAGNAKIAFDNQQYNPDSVRMFSYGLCSLQTASLLTDEKVIIELRTIVESCQTEYKQGKELIECNTSKISEIISNSGF